MIEAAAPKRVATDARREAIATAARALIVEKGVEGLRTRDIAERVGINIATLHYHVPTKEALIELVAESLRDEFVQQSLARPRAHLPAAEQLELEFVDFREVALERPGTMLVFSELMERARRDEVIAAAIRPMKHRWRQIMADMLSKGVSEGTYRPDLDPSAFATIMLSAFIGFCRSPERTSERFEAFIAELRRAIANPARTAATGLSNPPVAPRLSGKEFLEE